MSRKRRKYTPKPFESVDGNSLSANLYATMLQSKAWQHLNKGAMVLYTYMKLQYYGARNIQDHPNTDFVFNKAMATKVYPLYTNMTQFNWFAGCDGCEVNHKQGDYCPRCGKKIKVIQNDY